MPALFEVNGWTVKVKDYGDSEDRLVKFSVKSLENNGGIASLVSHIQAILDEGFMAEDFKKLNKYKDIFDINGPHIKLKQSGRPR